MLFFSPARRRVRPSIFATAEHLESRALLSATNGIMVDSGFVASAQAAPSGRATPRIAVAGDYSLESNDLGNGDLVITQDGNNIQGVFTTDLTESATFNASFKKPNSKVAKGTILVLFEGEEVLQQSKFKIKFRPDGDGFRYTYSKLKFSPAAT